MSTLCRVPPRQTNSLAASNGQVCEDAVPVRYFDRLTTQDLHYAARYADRWGNQDGYVSVAEAIDMVAAYPQEDPRRETFEQLRGQIQALSRNPPSAPQRALWAGERTIVTLSHLAAFSAMVAMTPVLGATALFDKAVAALGRTRDRAPEQSAP